MDEQTPVATMPPQDKKSIRPLLIVIGVMVLVMAVAALVAFFAFKKGDLSGGLVDPGSMAFVPAPDVLKNALFISDTQSYRVSDSGFEAAEETLPPEVETVYGYEFNQDATNKNAVVSPNKTAVAFAQLTSADEADASAHVWEIAVAHPKQGAQKTLGEGFAAIFLTERTVARATNTGVVETHLETGTERVLLTQSLVDNGAATPVSPNGSLIALVDRATSAILIYAATPQGLTLVTRFTESYSSFALNNDALFVLRAGEQGTDIFRYRFAQGATAEKVYTVPSSLKITSLKF
jgi:hypothetical protein